MPAGTLIVGLWQPLGAGLGGASGATWPDVLLGGASLALAVVAVSARDSDNRVVTACAAIGYGVAALFV
jgi:hypothetical protein